MARPLVLTYNLDALTAGKLRVLCQKQHIRWRDVRPEEYALPVGALAGIPTAKASPDAPQGGFNDPMLVMCNLLSTQMNAFLQGFRDEGIPRIALKAVLTPTNVTWNSVQLHDELAREHEAVQRMNPKK